MIHNIELNPGQGGKLVRSAGQDTDIIIIFYLCSRFQPHDRTQALQLSFFLLGFSAPL